jgi:hypothetical protein
MMSAEKSVAPFDRPVDMACTQTIDLTWLPAWAFIDSLGHSLEHARSVRGCPKASSVPLIPWSRPKAFFRVDSCVTVSSRSGGGVHPAMVLAQARALALSPRPGNRRRSSIAADSSPS